MLLLPACKITLYLNIKDGRESFSRGHGGAILFLSSDRNLRSLTLRTAVHAERTVPEERYGFNR